MPVYEPDENPPHTPLLAWKWVDCSLTTASCACSAHEGRPLYFAVVREQLVSVTLVISHRQSCLWRKFCCHPIPVSRRLRLADQRPSKDDVLV